MKSPCTRCNKERVISKTWTETIETYSGKSVITHTETICPDPECQAVVDKQLNASRERNAQAKADREKRAQERMQANNASKFVPEEAAK
jgi:hypothetical protein